MGLESMAITNCTNDNKGNKRNVYIYLGITFAIFAITTLSYLALIIDGIIERNDENGRILNHWPFYDNVNDEDKFDGFSGMDVILIYCSWGEELSDGELTYFVSEDMLDEDNNGKEHRPAISSGSIEAVDGAVAEWDSRIEGLSFAKTTDRDYADVEIHFREDRNERAGMTKNYYDFYGYITKSYVLISEGGFGFGFSDDQIQQIAKHEIGHVLGLGHANFDGNLMATQVNHGSGSISDCEIDAVHKANERWFERSNDNSVIDYTYDDNNGYEYIECK
jgi:hypothetical protein